MEALFDVSRKKPNLKNRVDETHDYELYPGLTDIGHTKTKARHPQTNGICDRFHKTILQEFYQPTFRRKLYSSLEELSGQSHEF